MTDMSFKLNESKTELLKIIGKERSAVLLEFYVRKQRDYKEGIDSTNGNNEAVLRKNIKINIKDSLNTIEDKDRKQNIIKL